jgi:hypothetical protein
MWHQVFATVALLLLALGLVVRPQSVRGCAAAHPPNVRVDIAQESAIIIWDAAHKVQHFIRRAAFETEAENFGFLVPTPTKPELAEAEDASFSVLEKLTEPKVETRRRFAFFSSFTCSKSARKEGSVDRAVRVLESKRVGRYDAAVLEATAPDALADWLKENGYVSNRELTDWLTPYVTAKWKITAFKIAKEDKQTADIATSAVRMTFKTDRPFFPYREPEDQRSPGRGTSPRLLRVYLLAASRMKGAMDAAASTWPGKVMWAGQLSRGQISGLLEKVKLAGKVPGESLWLTEFEDRSSPRPGIEDVFFFPSEDRSAVSRPTLIHHTTTDLGGLVCAAVVILPLVLWRILRFRRSPAPGDGGAKAWGIR